jgi:hypothetical protein
MTDKRHILAEITRLAKANEGKPPGVRKFESETGIRECDWYPDLWLRWGDALQEAGFTRNKMQEAVSDAVLLAGCARLAQRLARLPLQGELILESKNNPSFPSEKTFRRFGGKANLWNAVLGFCRSNSGYDDVIALCEGKLKEHNRGVTSFPATKVETATGFVYLIKSGRHYKIGRTNSLGRRQWELSIKIPIPPKTIHYIETDDPVGLETYWHKRFDSKRGEGEWFDLSPDDVAAFKRWKKIA